MERSLLTLSLGESNHEDGNQALQMGRGRRGARACPSDHERDRTRAWSALPSGGIRGGRPALRPAAAGGHRGGGWSQPRRLGHCQPVCRQGRKLRCRQRLCGVPERSRARLGPGDRRDLFGRRRRGRPDRRRFTGRRPGQQLHRRDQLRELQRLLCRLRQGGRTLHRRLPGTPRPSPSAGSAAMPAFGSTSTAAPARTRSGSSAPRRSAATGAGAALPIGRGAMSSAVPTRARSTACRARSRTACRRAGCGRNCCSGLVEPES